MVDITGTNQNNILFGTDGNDSIYGNEGDDTLLGEAGNDLLVGGVGNDLIIGGGGADTLNGWAGNDTLIAHGSTGTLGGILSGDTGDDYLEARKTGYGQYHMFGGEGNDTLVMDVTNTGLYWGHQGHHAFGRKGADKFVFTNIDSSIYNILGRIDDFDASRDSIWIDGQEIDLNAPPPNVRIVEYNGQQWIQIGSHILYALEGARLINGIEEVHFTPFPTDISSLPEVDYIDQVNFVPYDLYQAHEASGSLNAIDSNAAAISGTGRADLITADKASSSISGLDGNDVVNAGKGHDTVRGGDGDDSIAGGMDMDLLFGDEGNDHIFGGSENDTLNGGAGADEMFGGTGNDMLIGGGWRGQP